MADRTGPTSWRWWFEDRETGRVTVAQFPNWPLVAIAAVWLLGRFTEPGSWVGDALVWATRVLWLWWGTDELVRGVNPWRRVLGAAVILWQIGRIVT